MAQVDGQRTLTRSPSVLTVCMAFLQFFALSGSAILHLGSERLGRTDPVISLEPCLIDPVGCKSLSAWPSLALMLLAALMAVKIVIASPSVSSCTSELSSGQAVCWVLSCQC